MLLAFKCKNFKSFKNEVLFSLIPEKIHDISYSVLQDNYNGKIAKSLSGAVIYGPNAAGKTSIINAMSCFKQIILRGNIENEADNRYDDYVSHNMELIPFIFSNEESPVEFGIEFVYQNNKYEYELQINLGLFNDQTFDRHILIEKLLINDYEVFVRTKDDIIVSNLTKIYDLLLEQFDDKLARKNLEIAKANLSKTKLFLTSDFDSYFSKKIINNIKAWLSSNFIVVNKSNYKSLRPILNLDKNIAMIDENINAIAKEAGIVGTDFAYISENNKSELVSFIDKNETQAKVLPSELIESVGTLRLIGITPFIFKILQNGGTLVMDELDSSIHPMIIMNIINVFHNDEININKAQLIFNTHNPIFLNSQIYRRDEIKFVEKNKQTKISTLYSLSDFKTNGSTPVRNTTDYMRNYFINRYGAIEDVDFSDIFERFVRAGSNDDERKH